MRGLILTLAAAVVLTLTIGCNGQNSRNRQTYPRQQASAGAPRTNLYPMTSPPPGSVQPLQGYAPTRITASYNDGYADNNYARAGYGGGQQQYYGGGQRGGYVQSNTANTYARAGYAGDPFAGTVQNPFTPNGGVCRVEEITAYSNPNVPIQDPPVVVNRVNITTPYPGGVNTYDAMNASYSTGSYGGGYTTGTAGYASPYPTLSATSAAYGAAALGYTGTGAYGPYDMSSYGTTSNIAPPMPQNQTTYGRVEGTADIVMNPAALGLPSYGTQVGSGYVNTSPYAGGAYPRATATIPATHNPGPAPMTSNAAVPAAAPLSAGYNVGEIRLVPALDVPPGIHPNDAGPSQWFEIVRPGNGPLRIGRVSATCVCVGVRVPKRHIAAGERALVEARIVSKPQVNNLTYGIYVNIVEPRQTVVDADVTISL